METSKDKLTIAIDCDDVLNSFNESWISLYNQKSGDNLTIEQITDWDLKKFVLPGWEDKIFSEEIVYSKGFFLDIPVKDGAVEFMEYACLHHHIYVVSAAHHSTVNDKAIWLIEKFPFFDIRRFIPCYDKFLINADVLIDDGLHNLEKFGGKGMLLDRPWNRGNNEFERFYDLREVKNEVRTWPTN